MPAARTLKLFFIQLLQTSASRPDNNRKAAPDPWIRSKDYRFHRVAPVHSTKRTPSSQPSHLPNTSTPEPF